jgi:hypothetical protein
VDCLQARPLIAWAISDHPVLLCFNSGSFSAALWTGCRHSNHKSRMSRIMNATSLTPIGEARWKTYVRGMALLTPALIVWGMIRAKCVPILVEMCKNSGHSQGGFWDFSMFLVQFGFLFFSAVVVCFILFELFIPAWRPYRRLGVTSFVWLVNFCIIIGLAALFTSSMILLPHLLK